MENLQPYQIAQEAIQRTGRMNVLFTSRHSQPVRAWLTAREPHPQVTQYDFYLNTSYGFKCKIHPANFESYQTILLSAFSLSEQQKEQLQLLGLF